MEDATDKRLVPNLESVVALIEQIVTLGWPDVDDDQAEYFGELGFQQRAGQQGFQKGYGYSPGPNAAADLGGELFSVELAVTDGSWSSYEGELFSINFFAYDVRDIHDKGAVLGYRFIYSQLLSRYGQPTDMTVRPFDEATSSWEVNGTSIEMYCYAKPFPLLQLGFSHISRNASYEADLTK